MVRRAAHQQDVGLPLLSLLDPQHFIVLAGEGDQLSREIGLIDVSLQPSAQEMGHRLIILRQIVGGAKLRRVRGDETFIGDRIIMPAGDPLGRHVELILRRQFPHDGSVPGYVVKLTDQVIQEIPADRILDLGGRHEAADLFVADALPDEEHDQLHDAVAPGPGEIRHDLRDRLRVRAEDLRIVAHVIAQHVMRGEHVQERLLPGTGRELPAHFEQVAVLILHDQALVLFHRRVPQIVSEPDGILQHILPHAAADILRDRFKILPRDPADVLQRHAVAAVPGDMVDAVAQRHRSHRDAAAQIAHDIRIQPVLQIVSVDVPSHDRHGAGRRDRGADLGHAGAQDMGQGVHLTVRIAVAAAVDHVPAAISDHVRQDAQRQLVHGDDARRLQHQHKAHVGEKCAVPAEDGYVVHILQREDTDIKVRSRIIRDAGDLPELRDVADLLKPFQHPVTNLILDPVPADDDQSVPVAKQRDIEREEDAPAQIPVERVGKENALSSQHASGGQDVIRGELRPQRTLPLQIVTEGLLHIDAAGEKLPDHGIYRILLLLGFRIRRRVRRVLPAAVLRTLLLCRGLLGPGLLPRGAGCRLLLIEQDPSAVQLQVLVPKPSVIILMFFLLLLGQFILMLLPGHAAQIGSDLAEQDDAVDRIEPVGKTAQGTEPVGDDQQYGSVRDQHIIENGVEQAELSPFFLQEKLLLLRFIFIEESHPLPEILLRDLPQLIDQRKQGSLERKVQGQHYHIGKQQRPVLPVDPVEHRKDLRQPVHQAVDPRHQSLDPGDQDRAVNDRQQDHGKLAVAPLLGQVHLPQRQTQQHEGKEADA